MIAKRQTPALTGLVSYIRLDAPNDSNGNPQRVFLVFRNGEMVACVDEGYQGARELKKKWPTAVQDHHLPVYRAGQVR